MIKLIILVVFFNSLLFSYQKGDEVNLGLQKTLGMNESKIYIVDFFASWCSSCEKEIPYISKVHKKVDATKVEIIGVDVDKDIKKAKAFQEDLKSKNSLTFRVVNDPMNNIIKEFKPIGMPALFYVQSGKVVDVIYGAIDNIDEVILKDLKRLQND